jgi:signal transduction histidine kinase
MDQDLEVRLAFLDLGGEDVARLSALRPVFEACADDLVEAFYDHLMTFRETRELLTDSGVRDRLLHAQRAYLLSLCDATLDAAYVEDRCRIGETHFRVGLEPRWYFGAYALYFTLLTPRIFGHYAGKPDLAEAAIASLEKLLMLDAQLAVEAYVAGREERLGMLARELEESGRGLAKQVDAQRVALEKTRARARAAEHLASVGTLAAGLAHEIGTPMSVIRGHAELLESAVEEGSRARVQTIIEQIDRIANIMQGLLNLARPHEPQRGPVALADVLETSLSFLSEKFRRRGIEVQRDFEEIPDIAGDADKLQQLFLNLILNAVDAMDGGGRLRILIGRADPRHVEARIADDGVGIPAEDLPHVFEPFFTSKQAGQGNGLGLVVAQGIAGDHGGRLEVESEPGDGTEFRVVLPL